MIPSCIVAIRSKSIPALSGSSVRKAPARRENKREVRTRALTLPGKGELTAQCSQNMSSTKYRHALHDAGSYQRSDSVGRLPATARVGEEANTLTKGDSLATTEMREQRTLRYPLLVCLSTNTVLCTLFEKGRQTTFLEGGWQVGDPNRLCCCVECSSSVSQWYHGKRKIPFTYWSRWAIRQLVRLHQLSS